MKKIKSRDARLTKDISPLHYNIMLTPDLDNFTFIGEETIDIKIDKPTKKIKLHSAELELLSVSLNLGKREMAASEVKYDDKAEEVTLLFSEPLTPGNAKLHINFSGILNDKMRGFYRSRYDLRGKTFHMGVTQFESTDARRAFPCFDEPAKKATFDVALKVPNDRTVISNTVETEVLEHSGGYKTVKFAPTPKMSSYLLAFIIGHFEYIEKKTKEGVVVRVYVTPGKKKQAQFALDTAATIMSFYTEYFGIDYPLKTMDLIAIPDFANGAMENWGAVTYRETALLVDEENSSIHTKQWVALVIAHELAHQWFGNLVTMEWWTHLWLNEGFASFMEYVAVDKIFPGWHVWTQFVYTEQAKALSLDGLENTHAIEIPVYHPAEISEIFDAVSYSKGASVIRMLEAYLGEANFRKGLNLYLNKFKFGNATTEDLWRALEKASGVPVAKIMKNWTATPGYPLITVDKAGDKLTLSQERFYASVLATKKNQSWIVPISVISDVNKIEQKFLIDGKKITTAGFSKSKWIKANTFDTSFVRINYADEIREALAAPIKSGGKAFTEEGKFALVRDTFALVESGHVDADEALEFASYYKSERSYIVWAEIITRLMEIRRLIYGQTYYEDYKKFARELLEDIVKYVGFTNKSGEDHAMTLLRSAAIHAAGIMGDAGVINKAKELFIDIQEGKKVDADLKSLIYALAAENGGAKEFKYLKELYLTAEAEEEKDRALRGLCSLKDERRLLEVLDLAFSDKVRAQDAMKSIYFVAANLKGRELAWEYLKKNWKKVSKKFGGGHLLARFISPLAYFATDKKAEEIEQFFKKNSEVGIERTIAQVIEQIRSNASVIDRNSSNIENYLKSK